MGFFVFKFTFRFVFAVCFVLFGRFCHISFSYDVFFPAFRSKNGFLLGFRCERVRFCLHYTSMNISQAFGTFGPINVCNMRAFWDGLNEKSTNITHIPTATKIQARCRWMQHEVTRMLHIFRRFLERKLWKLHRTNCLKKCTVSNMLFWSMCLIKKRIPTVIIISICVII